MESNQNNLLKKLRMGDKDAYSQLYKTCYKSIEGDILRNSGSQADAQDVFQEAIIVLFENYLFQKDFKLTVKLCSFLRTIAFKMWLKKLRKAPKKIDFDIEEYNIPSVEIDLSFLDEEDVEVTSQQETVVEKLEELGEDCQKIIQYKYYENLSHEEIAERMGFSIRYSRIKLFRCRNRLKKLLQNPKN